MISKDDFQTWKGDPVTKAFFLACQERVEDCKDILANSAGFDSVNDNYNRGFIAAYIEMQSFKMEESDE